MSTGPSCHFYLLQVSKKSLWSLILYNFLYDLIHVCSPMAGTESPRGQNFDLNRKALSLYPFVASFKEISLKSDFIHFFHDLIHVYSPGAGAYSPQGTVLMSTETSSLRSSVASFKSQRNIVSENIHCFNFFPYKSIRDQIWPCRKIGHGQPRVIIWANLVVLKHPMMHTKIQGHWPFGSGEDFFRLWRPSWSCDQNHLSKLFSPIP